MGKGGEDADADAYAYVDRLMCESEERLDRVWRGMPDGVQKSPYYVRPEEMTPLQKHCAFFDRNGDGLIMPWETFEGFRILGYGVVLSLLGALLTHVFFSYRTLDTWVPDPFFAIVLRNVHRLKHGSDSEVYEHDGTLKCAAPTAAGTITTLLGSYDRRQNGGLTLADAWRMTQQKSDVMDVFGWCASKIEWFYLWILAQRSGVVSWDDIAAQYDGTLFTRIERTQRRSAKM